MKRDKFIASASSAGKLMTNPRSKKDRDAGKLSQTALTYIEDTWLRDRYGYKEPMVTNETLKGQMCEQDAFALIQSQIPASQFRVKNKNRITTNLYTGECDIDLKLDDVIEDAKASYTLRTFFAVKEPPQLYYTQAQVYMKLYERSRFRLIYCLVDTPDALIEQELNRYRWKFSPDGDTDNRHYQEIEEQMYLNHKVEARIPAEERIKVFDFDRDDEHIEELDRRVLAAQEIYNSLTLNGVKESRFSRAA